MQRHITAVSVQTGPVPAGDAGRRGAHEYFIPDEWGQVGRVEDTVSQYFVHCVYCYRHGRLQSRQLFIAIELIMDFCMRTSFRSRQITDDAIPGMDQAFLRFEAVIGNPRTQLMVCRLHFV